MDSRQFLRQKSLEEILGNQTEEGAIIAGATFSQYNYSWFRDGAFIAYAMIRAGKMEEAEKFISWKVHMITSYLLLMNFFNNGIQALQHRWKKCVTRKEDC